MELPTYTNIWKIEKRLYKLYDFRLPMPLPVGQIAAFLAIAVPYTIILTMVGMPFSHTWLWVYVLPPGVLAWLVTRPVLEGKRLPELASSQLRYLAEPRTWCRMAPLAEKDEILLSATDVGGLLKLLSFGRGWAKRRRVPKAQGELLARSPACNRACLEAQRVSAHPVSVQPVAVQAMPVQQASAPPAAVRRVAVRVTAAASPCRPRRSATTQARTPLHAAPPGSCRSLW